MKPPTIIKATTRYEGRVISLVEEELAFSNGKRSVHSRVLHPGAVVILPQRNDGTLMLIHQYRHSMRMTLLEFPAGTLEAGEMPLECAKREIMEEIKFAASDWTDLGELYPAPGFCSEIQYCFLARNLSPQALEGDDDEMIEVVEMPIAQVEQAIEKGEIRDGKSISIFARARLKGLL